MPESDSQRLAFNSFRGTVAAKTLEDVKSEMAAAIDRIIDPVKRRRFIENEVNKVPGPFGRRSWTPQRSWPRSLQREVGNSQPRMLDIAVTALMCASV